MHVGLIDDYTRIVPELKCFERLKDHRVSVWHDIEKDADRLAERLSDVEALILTRERTSITAELLERLPKLKMITLNGPFPHIDVEACTAKGIVVCSNRPAYSYATAELTWGLAICAMRRIPQEIERLKNGLWQGSTGMALHGRTLGIYGYGRIGKTVAGYGKAFGMRVIVWSRERGRAEAHADGYEVMPSSERLFEDSDILILSLKLVPETEGIVKAADLARMKPSAVFINTSRANLVEKNALVSALKAGRPGAAAVDVFENEPVLDASDPLLHLDNVICTPHIGFVERGGLERYYSDQVERVLAFADGRPVDVQNPEALAPQTA